MKKENNSKLERASVPDLTPLKLQFPVGYGADMVTEVEVRPPTAETIIKYNIKEFTDQYVTTGEGLVAWSYACLPKLADDYKKQLSFPDMLKIVERVGTFM